MLPQVFEGTFKPEPAEACHGSLTRGSVPVAQHGGLQVLLVVVLPLMVFVWALLLPGQAIPHAGPEVLPLHIAPTQDQSEWPQKRAFIHGTRPHLLMSNVSH